MESISGAFRGMGQTAQAEYYDALAEKTRNPQALYAQQRALERIKQAKTPEEINKIKADTYQSLMSGRLSESRYREIDRLLDLRAEAERLGNVQKVAELSQYISVLLPDELTGGYERSAFFPDRYDEEGNLIPGMLPTMRATELVEQMGKGVLTPSDELALEKFGLSKDIEASGIKESILDNPKSDKSRATYQLYNKLTDEPQIAVTGGGKKVSFVPLGKLNGEIVTGRDVYEAADALGLNVEVIYQMAQEQGVDILTMIKLLSEDLGGQ